MIHYNNDNNANCCAVNAQILRLLYTRNKYSYSHFDIFICIYSDRGEIDQMLNKYIQIYHQHAQQMFTFLLHIYWSPYNTFKYLYVELKQKVGYPVKLYITIQFIHSAITQMVVCSTRNLIPTELVRSNYNSLW